MNEVFVRVMGEYACAVNAAPIDLRAELADVTPAPPRRIDRFIEIALLGAGRCLLDVQRPPDTAVYLATTRGDLHATLDVLKPLVLEGQLPRPNTFINTVSNAACFHLAGCFALTGRSYCIGGHAFAFESALQLALMDLRAGAIPAALVGAVDTPAPPYEEHRRRFGLSADARLMETSRWLLLMPTSDGALARIDVQRFVDRDSLRSWLAAGPLEHATFRTNDPELLHGPDKRSVATESAQDESPTAAALCGFLRGPTSARPLVVATTDALGRVAATTCLPRLA